MTTKKAKSMGKTTLWGVRLVGSKQPDCNFRFWDECDRWKAELYLHQDNRELVRVTVEPVKKGKK